MGGTGQRGQLKGQIYESFIKVSVPYLSIPAGTKSQEWVEEEFRKLVLEGRVARTDDPFLFSTLKCLHLFTRIPKRGSLNSHKAENGTGWQKADLSGVGP